MLGGTPCPTNSGKCISIKGPLLNRTETTSYLNVSGTVIVICKYVHTCIHMIYMSITCFLNQPVKSTKKLNWKSKKIVCHINIFKRNLPCPSKKAQHHASSPAMQYCWKNLVWDSPTKQGERTAECHLVGRKLHRKAPRADRYRWI